MSCGKKTYITCNENNFTIFGYLRYLAQSLWVSILRKNINRKGFDSVNAPTRLAISNLTRIDRNGHLDLPGTGFILKKFAPRKNSIGIRPVHFARHMSGTIQFWKPAYGPVLHGYMKIHM